MQRKNTTADDIGSVIGYTATAALCSWFGGEQLYVPQRPAPDHPVIGLIGLPAFSKLCQEFGGDTLNIPIGYNEENRRNKRIAQLIQQGKSSEYIAKLTGLSERRVNQLKAHILSIGLIAVVAKAPGKKPRAAAQMPPGQSASKKL